MRFTALIFVVAFVTAQADSQDLIDLFEDVTEPSSVPRGNDLAPYSTATRVTSELSVTVNGINDTSGHIQILVYDDANAFTSHDYTRAAGYVLSERATRSCFSVHHCAWRGPLRNFRLPRRE